MRTSPRFYLVPHTHWDREWYRPFQSFRIELVDLVDRVLEEIEADADFGFTLDGQLVTVDDYLEIRPEARKRIARHVASGRLSIGPWLVLMDEFLVSGETLVRNLEAGMLRADELGGAMRVGYLPDMFGHVAQMPQLLLGAGVRDAVVWRGVPAAVTSHAFWWQSPDGSRVRTEYLPGGYGNAAHLFDAPDRLVETAERLGEAMGPWFGDDPVLAMYGTDHTVPDAALGPLVSRLNEAGVQMRIATVAEYIAEAPPLTEGAAHWIGEMRSGARANVLMGVTSARIDIKQAAGRVARLLERYAEPLSAVHLPASAWPDSYLRLAWRRVLESSAHDSICGCSVDAATRQVLGRLAEAEQVADALTGRVGSLLASRVTPPGAAIANPSPARRSGTVELEFGIPDTWDAVALELPDGSRIPTQELWRNQASLLTDTKRGAQVEDLFRKMHGREIFDHQWNGYRIQRDASGGPTLTLLVDVDADPAWLDVAGMRREIERAMMAEADVEWRIHVLARPRRRVLASVPAPALGWTTVRPVPATGDAVPIEHPVRAVGAGLDNDLLRIDAAPDGTLDLIAADGTIATGIARLVDGGDFGDTYNYGPPLADSEVSSPNSVRVELVEHGPVRGRLRVWRTFEWPARIEDGGARRAAVMIETTTITEVELRAGEPFARLTISFENRSDDHRVRAHVPLPRPARHSDAEGQFAVTRRGVTAEGGYGEVPLPTYPAHGWVDAGGVALLLDHVMEYELTAVDGDEAQEVALTVLRSVGLLSRNENPYREDPAGPQIPVPAAQMRGPWKVSFGILPHAGDWQAAGVPGAAERYANDLVATPSRGPGGSWPPAGAGDDALLLEGDGVVLSELRRRDGGWLELRLVNLAPAPREAIVRGSWSEARESDLLGRPGSQLPNGHGLLRVSLSPAEIRTIRVLREGPPAPAAPPRDRHRSRVRL